jgi:hypothetical protein
MISTPTATASRAPVRAASLSIGDLIRVDDDLDTWAVVEEEPVEDFEDPDSLVMAWRDDQGHQRPTGRRCRSRAPGTPTRLGEGEP